MNISLAGYGKMGREVEAIAIARGHTISAIFDEFTLLTVDAVTAHQTDVIIDFTQPDAVVSNVTIAAKTGVPIVIGTTGWDSEQERVKKIISESGTGCVAAANFSIGVNLFLKIVENASHLLNDADYDVYINEAHHHMKKDFPSGTALKVAEAVLSGMTAKKNIQSILTQGEAPKKDALLISSIRAGAIMGTHTVGYESDVDSIELTHTAKSRKGFALGAVHSAEWIVGKKGYFRFEEKIGEILSK